MFSWHSCKKDKNEKAPFVQFTSPIIHDSESVLRKVHISVNAFPSGKRSIKKVEFFVDNELLPNGTDTEAPWECDWESTDKFGQPRVLKAVATDSEGDSHDTTQTVVVFNGAEKSKMPTARYAFTSNVVNGKIYVIGGYNASNNAFKVVEEYDPATDTWTTKKSCLSGHAAQASCVINNIIYVFGGDKGFDWTGAVEAYNPATDQWVPKDSIPVDSNAALGMSSVAELNGKAYLIGGFTNPEPARIAEYDPVTDKWRLTKSYKRNYNAEALILNNQIYFIGGCPFRSIGFCDNPSDSLQIYDPVTESWTSKANMLSPHSGHSSTIYNGKIYVMGGMTNGSGAANKNFEVYDPATDTWKNLPSLPQSLSNFSCNTVNGKIYIISQDHVFEYTPD
ncbi:MAG: hypothetical protein HYZ54_13945 [Ignavibacteriae bacterium]|nr:hypothetical protein [Ignavibacteriota bacterium]